MSSEASLSACSNCDLLQEITPADAYTRVYCARCHHVLRDARRFNLQTNLAFAVTVLVLLIVANYFPVLSMELEGQRRAATIIESAIALSENGRTETALLVFFVAVLVPLVRAFAVIYITLPLLYGKQARHHSLLIRFIDRLGPWGMTEVYLLGALVAYVKLGDLAGVIAGPALFALGALSIFSAMSTNHLRSEAVWRLGDS